MFNFGDMFQKMKEMQDEMKQLREGFEDINVDAEAGGGMVRVTANLNKKIRKIEIDKDIIQPDDPEMMEDLIIAAVNKALEKAEEKAQEELKKFTSSRMPNIPGMDMSKFGF